MCGRIGIFLDLLTSVGTYLLLLSTSTFIAIFLPCLHGMARKKVYCMMPTVLTAAMLLTADDDKIVIIKYDTSRNFSDGIAILIPIIFFISSTCASRGSIGYIDHAFGVSLG